MTENKEARFIDGILELAFIALNAESEKHRMTTDELKWEVEHLKHKTSEHTCPCCGAEVSSHSVNANYSEEMVHCPRCDADYEWRRR